MSQVSHATWQHHGIQTTTDQLFRKINPGKLFGKIKATDQSKLFEKLNATEQTSKLFGKVNETTTGKLGKLNKTHQTTNPLFPKRIEYYTEKLFGKINKTTHKATDQLFRKINEIREATVKLKINETKKSVKILDEGANDGKTYENANVNEVFDENTNTIDKNTNVIKTCDVKNIVQNTYEKIIHNDTISAEIGKNQVFNDKITETNEILVKINKDTIFDQNVDSLSYKSVNFENSFSYVECGKQKRDEVVQILKNNKKLKTGKDTSTKKFCCKEEKCRNPVVWKIVKVGKRKDEKRWNVQALFLSLLLLNLVGVNCAEDGSNYSSGLTSRMIASFLGYGHTCTVGGVPRACTLTLTCWLRGGTRLRGCGGWLFSCCTAPREYDNSISSSEWKYKVSPPKLRQVPQRAGMPNNVFRRRVDEDVSQMECGLPSSSIFQKRIIGGRQARFAEFPWQAHVRISEFQCGGVLVSRWYVATAAHCVSRAPVRDIVVWLGAVDTSDTQPATKLGITQKVLHPLFQFRMTQPDRYDIALLKFARPIAYSNYILPICLPDYELELRGRNGVIAGWGKTDASSGHTGTNILRSATVPILSKEQCINWHQSKQISVEIHSEMICAGHSDGHQDACLGDSGGPLIVLDSGRYYLVGITSAGFGCGVDHQPGIYHNVKMTANWIRHVIMNTYHGVN